MRGAAFPARGIGAVVSWAFFAEVMVSVFALVDPFGALPFFVALTEGYTEADTKIVVRRAILVLGGILGFFALLGRFLFSVFGFTLGAFEIAGGILLFTVAFDMLRGEVAKSKLTDADRESALARRDEIAVVPLGIPLLAGPGAISTVMIYEGSAGGDPSAIAVTFLAVAVTTAISYLVLEYGRRIFRSLGHVGITVLARVMGLLLAAIAVQFVVNGIAAVLPSL
jgi:multiple antibiotic resistance protein